MNKEDKDYEELIALIEEQADDWLEDNSFGDEFEDIDDEIRTFRFEYAHESLSEQGHTRFKRWNSQ